MQTFAPGNLPQTTTRVNGNQRAIILSTVIVIVLAGISFYWLQWSSQQGITMGYPQPQVHIDALPSNIRSQQNVNFATTASGRDLTYVWTFVGQNNNNSFFGTTNTNATDQSATGKNPTYRFPVSGTYTVTVKATDPLGHSSSDTQTVKVLPVPPVATFTAQATNGFFGYSVSVDASKSQVDPGTTIQSYIWNFGDGSSPYTTVLSSAFYNYTNPGNYTITLTVVDATGQQSPPYKQTVNLTANGS
jgi:PKD repeat protein